MKKGKELIRFDWAMKKLLRQKANFDILEGFLSELLQDNIKIKQILDSESNKESENDKHNRVDILVENHKHELVIVEIQNSKEYDYFHRILYGTSKAISEHIKEGSPYSFVKKIISITIAYFDLGQGQDYVYHGITSFKGIHKGDILTLAERQQELYDKEQVSQIFPEYWLIKVSQFGESITDKLDEWIYFLKTGEIEDGFTAKGLTEAKDKLDKMKLSDNKRKEYQFYLKRLRDIASEQYTKIIDAQDAEKRDKLLDQKEKYVKQKEKEIKQREKEAKKKEIEIEQKAQEAKKKEIEIVIEMHQEGITEERIAKIVKIPVVEVKAIIENDEKNK
jgi:predicted transposase/invertase (TIGR01784 family)